MFVLLQRNRPSWFEGESARGRHYTQGRISDHVDEHVGSGRYLDQPSDETALHSAEADVENEPVN
jgi:hypothetical protein